MFLRKQKIKLTNTLWIITVANLATLIIGYILTISFYTGELFYSLIVTIFGFAISLFTEFGIIYAFLRKKIKTPKKQAFKISLIMNLASYTLITAFLIFANVNYPPLQNA